MATCGRQVGSNTELQVRGPAGKYLLKPTTLLAACYQLCSAPERLLIQQTCQVDCAAQPGVDRQQRDPGTPCASAACGPGDCCVDANECASRSVVDRISYGAHGVT